MSWILTTLLAFIAVIGIADIFGENPYKSFWSNFERMEGFITTLHLLAYFLVMATMLDTDKLWKRFFQTSIGVSVIAGGYGILQLLGKININQGGVRLDGTFGNASYFGTYMMFHVFLTAFLLLRERTNRTLQWIYGAVILLQVFIIYHTATRGVIIGLIIGTFVFGLILALGEKERPMLRKISMWSVGVLAALVLIFIGIKNTDFVRNNEVLGRFASINFSELRPRLLVWNMAWQGFKERPILGWGQESFNFVFNKYYDPKMYTQEQWFDRTHNIFLDWLISGGIFGLLGYLALFGLLFFYIWKSHAEIWFKKGFLKRLYDRLSHKHHHTFSYSEKAILTALLVAYFIQNIFVFDNLTSYMLFFAFLAYIHTLNSSPMSEKWEKRISFDPGLANRIIAPLVIVLTVFSVYFLNVKQFWQARRLSMRSVRIRKV